MLWEGTGEANRAVDAALGIGLPATRPLVEPGEAGEDAIGTGRGCVEDEPSLGADMVAPPLPGVVFVVGVVVEARILSHDYRGSLEKGKMAVELCELALILLYWR